MNLKALLAKPAVALAALAAVGGGAGIAALASADTATSSTSATQGMNRPDRALGVHGNITAIDGNTITIEDQGFGKNATETTYTIDASNASVVKFEKPTSTTDSSSPTAPTETTISVSALAVGDEIGVEGTVSGTSVTATKITSGLGGFMGRGGFGRGGSAMGHGAMGTVTAVNGNTVTIANGDGTTYTIDASNATVEKMVTESVSDIQVGDRIDAQGTVSGTSVTANHIMDGVPAHSQNQAQTQ